MASKNALLQVASSPTLAQLESLDLSGNDVKVEGVQRHMNGKMRDVFVYQRDFRKVDGVTIPFVLETAVDGFPETHKMLIEKAAVNPKLDSSLFEKPHA